MKYIWYILRGNCVVLILKPCEVNNSRKLAAWSTMIDIDISGGSVWFGLNKLL